MTDLAGQLRRMADGSATSSGVVDDALRGIAEGDGAVRAFVAVFAAEARAEAAAADRRRAQGGVLPPLLGVPVAVKGDLRVAGRPHPLARHGRPEPQDSPEIARLRQAGAVVLGHTALSEGALWADSSSRLFGTTRNPAHPLLSPGGSSGGSAAAVAAGYVAAAVGTDMGGSIRIPAACCGLTVHKPGHEQDPDDPASLRWTGLRAVGPLARTVQDCALLHDVLSGAYARTGRLELYDACRADPAPARIGLVRPDDCPDGIISALDAAALVLGALGHTVRPSRGPDRRVAHVAAPRYLRAAAEEIASLGGAVTMQRRTMQAAFAGRLVPSRAADTARLLSPLAEKGTRRLFDEHDLLLTPTLAGPVPSLADLPDHSAVLTALRQRRLARHTIPWNVTGQPAIALPLPGPPDRERQSRPLLSLQLIGRQGEQALLLAVARQLQGQLLGR